MDKPLDILANSILKQKEAVSTLEVDIKANFKAVREEFKAALKALPKPVDGKDIDYTMVKTLLDTVLTTYFSKETIKLGELQEAVSKATDETTILDLIDSYMTIHKDTFIGPSGKDGLNGKDGKTGLNGVQGKDGKDGKSVELDLTTLQSMIIAEIGKIERTEDTEVAYIVDMSIKDYDITVMYSDGKSKAIRLPKTDSNGIAYTMPNSGITRSAVTTMIAAANTGIFSTDIEITDFNKGVILRDPNNVRWRITIGIDGILTTTQVS